MDTYFKGSISFQDALLRSFVELQSIYNAALVYVDQKMFFGYKVFLHHKS